MEKLKSFFGFGNSNNKSSSKNLEVKENNNKQSDINDHFYNTKYKPDKSLIIKTSNELASLYYNKQHNAISLNSDKSKQYNNKISPFNNANERNTHIRSRSYSYNNNNPEQRLHAINEEYLHRCTLREAEISEENERTNRIKEYMEEDIYNKEKEELSRIENAEKADLAMEYERLRRIRDHEPKKPFLYGMTKTNIDIMSPNSPMIYDDDNNEEHIQNVNRWIASNISMIEKITAKKILNLQLQVMKELRSIDSTLNAELTRKLTEIERQRLMDDTWLLNETNEYNRILAGQKANALEDAEQRSRICEFTLEKEAAKLESQTERQVSYDKVIREVEMERENQILHRIERLGSFV